MSDPCCYCRFTMHNQGKIVVRVRLEPVLEKRAAEWSPSKRRMVAAKLERWARQLRISAKIIEKDQSPPPPRPQLGLHPKKAALN